MLLTTITNVGEDVKKSEPSYTVDGDVKWCGRYGNSLAASQRLNTELIYGPAIAIPLLGRHHGAMTIYEMRQVKTFSHKHLDVNAHSSINQNSDEV